MDLDELIRTISARERRFVLYYLCERSFVSVEEMADVVATWLAVEDGTAPVNVDDRDRLLETLHETHLPVLAERDLVEYERDSGTVHTVSQCGPLNTVLETTASLEHARRG